MPTFHVDPSWYEHTWLTERPPSRVVLFARAARAGRLSRRAQAAARHLARGLTAFAAMF
jgi:hypothetical protein